MKLTGKKSEDLPDDNPDDNVVCYFNPPVFARNSRRSLLYLSLSVFVVIRNIYSIATCRYFFKKKSNNSLWIHCIILQTIHSDINRHNYQCWCRSRCNRPKYYMVPARSNKPYCEIAQNWNFPRPRASCYFQIKLLYDVNTPCGQTNCCIIVHVYNCVNPHTGLAWLIMRCWFLWTSEACRPLTLLV